MSHPFATMAARLARVFRRAGTGRELAAQELVAIDVSGPTPLLAMYRDVLGQHGIPAVVTDAGVGPGALGGVPGYATLRVHAADAARARRLVHEDAEDGDGDATDGERTLTRGE